jgi:nucleotide-binding universal stress UspA family protein
MKVKNILVAIDIQDESDNIIDFAIEVGLSLEARLDFIYTIKPYLPDASKSVDDVLNDHSQTLEEMVTNVAKERAENLDVYFHITHGFAEERILEMSGGLDSDLIIMGIKQSKIPTVPIFPSISLDILNKSVVPVLFVPETFMLKTVDSILFTIDFKFEEIDAILDAMIFARSLDAEVTALHVCETDETPESIGYNIDIYKRLFKHRQRKQKINFVGKVGNAEHEILDYIDMYDVDILCLMVHKQKPLERFFKVSVANKLARSCPIPFMVMHPEPKRVVISTSELGDEDE